MANIAAVECTDEICRLITGKDVPFGGIPFIGLGDFRQVAPVVKGQGCIPTLLASIKSSRLWPQFSIHSLHQPIRGARDHGYTDFVDRIGEDYVNPRTSLEILEPIQSLEDAVTFLYPPEVLRDPSKCLARALLSPKNIFVDEFNEMILDILPGPEGNALENSSTLRHTNRSTVRYYSADIVKENNEVILDHPQGTPDYLAMLKQTGIPSHELRLKEGCICSLMRNMSVRKGLVKNARLIVQRLHQRFVEVRVINNRTGQLGDTHCIPRIRFEFTPPRASWTVHRLQFPLRLAYASTFNGCQGLTLDRTVLDLRCEVFAHGQLYTALSRIRIRNDSRVLFSDGAVGNDTANVVYKDLLL